MSQTAVKEKPILFSGPMIRALLDGRKTQTRRIVKLDKEIVRRNGDLNKSWVDPGGTIWGPGPYLKVPCATDIDGTDDGGTVQRLHCLYGYPGDRLWVRESCWIPPEITSRMIREGADTWPKAIYAADNPDLDWLKEHGWLRRNSIYMPRWASRITLEVTEVRVQRLGEISEADAEAEGCEHTTVPGCGVDGKWCHNTCSRHGNCMYMRTRRTQFQELWQQINGTWNPDLWVWAITFKRIKP